MKSGDHPSIHRIRCRTGLFVFLAVLALAIPQAALLPLLDRDEPRFAEATREMRQSGNYIVPTFNQEPRYNKPPMIYWGQALSFTIFGENAFAARLPSLVATAATTLLLFWWGSELVSITAGLATALCYAFCLQTMQQGRVATADALLIFWMTWTVFAGAKMLGLMESSSAENWGRKWIISGGLLALGFAGGFLAKGPEAFLPIFPLLFCARKQGERLLLSLLSIFALSLLLVSLWAVPALVQSQGDYWRVGMSEGVAERAVSGLQGHGASSFGWYLLGLPFYLVTFWLSALPWSPWVITQRQALFQGWKPDALDTYLLLNVGLIFLVFSLMVTKLPHYTLPTFPLLVLLLARRWTSAGKLPSELTKLAWIFGAAWALVALIIIPIALAYGATPSPVRTLVHVAQPDLTHETQFALVDFQEPNAVWEMRGMVSSFASLITPDQVATFLGQSGPHAVIISTSLWRQLNIAPDPTWKTYEASGWNAARLSPVHLTLIVHR